MKKRPLYKEVVAERDVLKVEVKNLKSALSESYAETSSKCSTIDHLQKQVEDISKRFSREKEDFQTTVEHLTNECGQMKCERDEWKQACQDVQNMQRDCNDKLEKQKFVLEKRNQQIKGLNHNVAKWKALYVVMAKSLHKTAKSIVDAAKISNEL